MDALFKFLNQPIVLTIISLSFGGYLVGLITARRARNDKRRDQAISFLAETASAFNAQISSMYGVLRTGKPYTHEEAMSGVVALYSRRMSVRLASEVYLRSDSFPGKYDEVLNEIQGVAFLMPSLAEGIEPADVYVRRTQLRAAWPLENEPPRPAADTPSGELQLWLDMILDRITAVLSSALTAVMK